MLVAAIKAVEYYLPEQMLTNENLEALFPEFPADKIFAKTGIRQRHIAAVEEQSSDMAVKAAQKLFSGKQVSAAQIDFVLFCTQTPDYLLPTSACLIQMKLGLPHSVGALDFNLGCSGYVYGISLAKALIESGQAKNVLLLTADSYTKLIEPSDKSVRSIFGDGASATWMVAIEADTPLISPAVYGSDGTGANNLCVLGRSMKNYTDVTADPFLRMNGPNIFSFALDVVPKLVHDVLIKEGLSLEDIELFVFHQANAYMLTHLRKKLSIPQERFFVAMDFCGNTVSSTIPIALKEAQKKGVLKGLHRVLIVGFGVGYSWAASIIDVSNICIIL